MRFQQTFHVLGITRYKIDDGNMGATVFVRGEHRNEPDKLGVPSIEFRTGYDLIDKVRDQIFPADFICDVEVIEASKHKGSFHVHDMKPVHPAKPAPAATNKS